MGIIVSGIKLIAEKLNKVYPIIVKYPLFEMQKSLEKEVRDIFSLIMPYTTKTVKMYTDDDGADVFLSRKCVVTKKDCFTFQHREVLWHIMKYGDIMCTYVRKTIREDFKKLVKLTKKLMPYTKFHIDKKIVATDIEIPIFDNDKITFRKATVNRIRIPASTTFRADRILLYEDGTYDGWITLEVTDMANLAVMEDIIDFIVSAYEEFEAKIKEVTKKNVETLEEMKKVVAPYAVSKKLRK
ncbi:hypothetical protein J7K27_10800 [Candidatus Bathyarchaeota archaeon]|nr:hypothetical protein [Candidatus Bathyarchaeota archaeon]